MITLEACLDRVAALHPRLCPRQVLGVRIGLHAGELLGFDLPQADKRLFTFVETDGCFADGVSVATGCWFGRRTLRLVDFGKVAATVVDTHTGRAVRVWPHPQARQRAVLHAPSAHSLWDAYLEAYRVMPAAELLDSAWVELDVSLAGVIGPRGVRVTCDSCGEEVLNARQVVRAGQTLCPRCAGDVSYYRRGPGDVPNRAVDAWEHSVRASPQPGEP